MPCTMVTKCVWVPLTILMPPATREAISVRKNHRELSSNTLQRQRQLCSVLCGCMNDLTSSHKGKVLQTQLTPCCFAISRDRETKALQAFSPGTTKALFDPMQCRKTAASSVVESCGNSEMWKVESGSLMVAATHAWGRITPVYAMSASKCLCNKRFTSRFPVSTFHSTSFSSSESPYPFPNKWRRRCSGRSECPLPLSLFSPQRKTFWSRSIYFWKQVSILRVASVHKPSEWGPLVGSVLELLQNNLFFFWKISGWSPHLLKF